MSSANYVFIGLLQLILVACVPAPESLADEGKDPSVLFSMNGHGERKENFCLFSAGSLIEFPDIEDNAVYGACGFIDGSASFYSKKLDNISCGDLHGQRPLWAGLDLVSELVGASELPMSCGAITVASAGAIDSTMDFMANHGVVQRIELTDPNFTLQSAMGLKSKMGIPITHYFELKDWKVIVVLHGANFDEQFCAVVVELYPGSQCK